MRLCARLFSMLLVVCLTAPAWAAQLVVLDFDSFTDATSDGGKDYVYSAGERTAIVDLLNEKFGPYPVAFTDTAPPPTAPPFGLFSNVYFNVGLSSAGDIDFQNKKKIDDAEVHIPKLLEIAGLTAPFASEDVIIASTNIAAHETLHLLGTRHHDSFLPIGEGAPSPFVAGGFDPPFPGPAGAALTSKEFNSLTTSIGFSASKLLDPGLFVGPRSAVKLLLDEFTDVDVDSDDANAIFSPQPLPLKTIPIPNPLPPSDPFSVAKIFADVVVVEEASIELSNPPLPPFPESDYYEVFAEAGDIIHVEVLSEILDFRLGDTLDTQVAVLDPALGYAPVPWFTGSAINDDERESSDSLIFDLEIPTTGTYVIEVFPGDDATGPETALGEYELLVYRIKVSIPEPSTLAIAALGGMPVVVFGRRRRTGLRGRNAKGISNATSYSKEC